MRISAANEFVWFGATLVEWMQADKREYGMPLDVPPIMDLRQAAERAPEIYSEISKARSGASLLNSIGCHIQKTINQKTLARQWSEELLLGHEYLGSKRLQSLARELIEQGARDPKATAALSIMAYALLGLAESLWLVNSPRRGTQRPPEKCVYCYRTALSPSQYCVVHRTSRKDRRNGTKTQGSKENLEVKRRRAVTISKIATQIRRDERILYGRLLRQLLGMAGGLSNLPSPLEDAQDNAFVTGPRIGIQGAKWFIYLWQVLPRVRTKLGRDWPQLVESALESQEWEPVLESLKWIDRHKQETDASKWAWTLIEAEMWAEAEEVERQQRLRGRPPRKESDPLIQKALAQIRDGRSLEEVARSLDVTVSTLHRWKQFSASAKQDLQLPPAQ